MKILWVGTGVMGAPMAGHLLAAGHTLTVSSRTRSKAAALEERGAEWIEDPSEAASRVDVVCTMVGMPHDVEGLAFGEDGLIARMQPGSIWIDFTTSSPDLARRIARAAEARGVAALDAPVSGGDVGARNAGLSIMAGGDRAAFDRCLPLFECVGTTVVYEGPAGAGQDTKMVNQILVASNMIGACECLLYAQRAGLDPANVFQSVGGGAAQSWLFVNLGPRMIEGDLEPGFYVEHFIKDMGIALEECRRMGLNLPGLQLAYDLYQRVADMGLPRKGTQALIRALEAMNAK